MNVLLSVLTCFMINNAFAQNDIKYNFEGIQVDKNQVKFDNSLWDISSEGNSSTFVRAKGKGKRAVVTVEKDSSGKVIGVSDPDGSKKFFMNDSIIKVGCLSDSEQTCNITHAFCDEFERKKENLDKGILSQTQPFQINFPEYTERQMYIFPFFKKYSRLGTRLVIDPETKKLNEAGETISELCKELEGYSVDETKKSSPAPEKSSSVSQQ